MDEKAKAVLVNLSYPGLGSFLWGSKSIGMILMLVTSINIIIMICMLILGMLLSLSWVGAILGIPMVVVGFCQIILHLIFVIAAGVIGYTTTEEKE